MDLLGKFLKTDSLDPNVSDLVNLEQLRDLNFMKISPKNSIT